MTLSPELLVLQPILENCRLHETGLCDALDDLALRDLCSADVALLGKGPGKDDTAGSSLSLAVAT